MARLRRPADGSQPCRARSAEQHRHLRLQVLWACGVRMSKRSSIGFVFGPLCWSGSAIHRGAPPPPSGSQVPAVAAPKVSTGAPVVDPKAAAAAPKLSRGAPLVDPKAAAAAAAPKVSAGAPIVDPKQEAAAPKVSPGAPSVDPKQAAAAPKVSPGAPPVKPKQPAARPEALAAAPAENPKQAAPKFPARGSSFDSAWRYCETLPDTPLERPPSAAETKDSPGRHQKSDGESSVPLGYSPATATTNTTTNTSTNTTPSPRSKKTLSPRSHKALKPKKYSREKFDKTYYRSHGTQDPKLSTPQTLKPQPLNTLSPKA